jgi:uncharacterized protein
VTETTIAIPSGGFTLQGTLTTSGATPAPAALLVSGSGPIDRDSNAKRMSIDVMRQIAEHLGQNGIASLRYDKRGVGESDGEYLSTGFHDNVDDARAALASLRSRPEVDGDRVVVIGHSEGALIAGVLASDPRLAGAVLLAGSAVNGKRVLRWQAEQIAPTLPTPVKWLMKLLRQDVVATQAKRLERLEAATDDVVRIQLVKMNAKWFREFMAFEPTDALRQAVVPILAITGSKDIQVDPDDVDRMRQVVSSPFDGHVVDDVTHLLRSETGDATVRTYKRQARRPIDQRVTRLLTDWVALLGRVD